MPSHLSGWPMVSPELRHPCPTQDLVAFRQQCQERRTEFVMYRPLVTVTVSLGNVHTPNRIVKVEDCPANPLVSAESTRCALEGLELCPEARRRILILRRSMAADFLNEFSSEFLK